MNSIKYLLIIFITLLLLAGCAKRNFFPDEDDPGLSLLTSHGYNIVTNYINGKPYINPFRNTFRGNYLPVLQKIVTGSTYDTLSLSWLIQPKDSSTSYNSPYQSISLLIPVPKTFTKSDFLQMSSNRFLNTNKIQIQSYFSPGLNQLSGKANIYFVEITTDSLNYTNYLSMTGLFDGNIGDSILITKGRFDFEINADRLNF